MSEKHGSAGHVNWRRYDEMGKLLHMFNFTCVICGHEFASLDCVTYEHLLPKSVNRQMHKHGIERPLGAYHLAPTHYRCNNLRGSGSIIDVALAIEAFEHTMKRARFLSWLNVRIPGRTSFVPEEERLPPRRALVLLRNSEHNTLNVFEPEDNVV